MRSRFSLFLGFVPAFFLLQGLAVAKDRWTELNIGPFYVDTDGDPGAAREALTQLEQTRWVLGGLLEVKGLPSLWPIRVLLTSENAGTKPTGKFVSQSGQYLLVLSARSRLPLDQVAGILLDANTPRLPAEVENGLRQLFATLEAHGSRVAWGGAPPRPDLDWARMQLFATKFEYGSSFHIFLTALKGGSGLRAAERNAFGKDSAALEQEAEANLASHNWQAIAVSGRPLDPKRDFGEHSLSTAAAGVYLADTQLADDPKAAEAAYKAAIEARGADAALGFEGLAQIAKSETQVHKDDPAEFLEAAIKAGSKSPPVYVEEAEGLPQEQALPLLKRAQQLNPLWAEPIFRQAQLAEKASEKEALLKRATQLAPRETQYWVELAKVQTAAGEATAAQSSWLRAEDSAPSDAERDRLHKLRVGSEQERLDAADKARREEREAAHLSDQRAQTSEADRIRAAEEKANQAVDTASGAARPENAVPWSQVTPQKKLTGTLSKVECLGKDVRLSIRDKSGATTMLLLKNSQESGVVCGTQQPLRRVSVTYLAEPDDRSHTSGTVVTLNVQ